MLWDFSAVNIHGYRAVDWSHTVLHVNTHISLLVSNIHENLGRM